MYPLLEEKMKERGWAEEQLADFLVESWQIAYNKLHGRTKFRALEKKLLADYFEVNEDELFKEEK